MKAIQKFKAVLARKALERGEARGSETSLGSDSSQKPFNPAEEKAKAEEIEALVEQRRIFINQRGSTTGSGDKGHAHDLTDHEPLFLGIGTGARDDFKMDEPTPNLVSDSPTAVDFNVYDRAYEAEVERIVSNSSRMTAMYLTRLVKEKDQYASVDNMVQGSATNTTATNTPMTGSHQMSPPNNGKFADFVTKHMAKG
jgi:calcium/calmodulin-dependent protein kinase kinase 2